MSDLKVTKSNALVNSSYRLSLNEQRLVIYGLSKIDPTSKEFPLSNRVHITEMAEMFGINLKSQKSFYDDVKNALFNKFWEREFSYFDEERGEDVRVRWLIEIRYGKEDGSISFYYNPLLKNHLQDMSNRFTQYFLSNVADMKSVYSMRIYEFAIMYLNASERHKNTFEKNISDLKEHLDIGDKYKEFYHFKARVLEVARKEINKKSDINISYEVIRRGHTAYAIKFSVSKKGASKHNATPGRCDKTADLFASRLKTETIEKAKAMCLAKRLDVYAIKDEFDKSITNSTEEIRSIDAYFIGFVKKKIT